MFQKYERCRGLIGTKGSDQNASNKGIAHCGMAYEYNIKLVFGIAAVWRTAYSAYTLPKYKELVSLNLVSLKWKFTIWPPDIFA